MSYRHIPILKQNNSILYELNKDQFTILSGYAIYRNISGNLCIEKSGINLIEVEKNRLSKQNKKIIILVYYFKNNSFNFSEIPLEYSLMDFYKFMNDNNLIIHHFMILTK